VPIQFHVPGVLAPLTGGRKQLEARGATVGEVVADVIERHPDVGPKLRDARGEPYPYVVFYLNDDDIRFRDGFRTPVKDGDEIVVVPAVAGG
jgi:molybdopterin converting factor small subunit